VCLLRYVCYVPGFVGVVLSCFVTILTDFYQFFLLQVIYRLYLATSNDIPVKFERRFYFRSDRNQVVQVVTTRPVESHSRAQGDILAAPTPNILMGPLWEENFWFLLNGAFWCTLIFSSDGRPPNVAEPMVTYPPYLTFSTGLVSRPTRLGNCLRTGKPFWYTTNTKVNTTFNASRIGKSSTGLPG